MEIGKYIYELLLENERVIIPGFGAFIGVEKHAEITGEQLIPPSKEISFNHQVRNNDGMLVGIIAEKEEVSHFDALKNIEKERDAIQERISKGERVVFEKLGVLFFAEDKIQFEPEKNNDLLLNSFGLEAISLADFPKYEKPVSQKEEQKETTSEPVIKELPIDIPDQPEPVYTVVDNNEFDEKKKRGWLWIVLILIPLGLASVFVLKQQKNEKLQTGSSQDSTLNISATPAEIVRDSIVQDSVEQDSIVPVVVQTEEKKDTIIAHPASVDVESQADNTSEIKEVKTDKPMYYLVGGSFKEKENAEKYIKQLRSEGFEPFYLGKKGSFFVVGIGQYETLAEASQGKQTYIEKNPGSGVWIKKE